MKQTVQPLKRISITAPGSRDKFFKINQFVPQEFPFLFPFPSPLLLPVPRVALGTGGATTVLAPDPDPVNPEPGAAAALPPPKPHPCLPFWNDAPGPEHIPHGRAQQPLAQSAVLRH